MESKSHLMQHTSRIIAEEEEVLVADGDNSNNFLS